METSEGGEKKGLQEELEGAATAEMDELRWKPEDSMANLNVARDQVQEQHRPKRRASETSSWRKWPGKRKKETHSLLAAKDALAGC